MPGVLSQIAREIALARLILAIVFALLALAAIKMVIIALIIAGLIFRTTTTIGLLTLGGLLNFTAAHPVLGLAITAALITTGIIFKQREEQVQLVLEDPDQE